MKIKLITLCVIICFGLSFSPVLCIPLISAGSITPVMTSEQIDTLLGQIPDKTLVFDDIIGDIHVQYWQHCIDGVIVKNDEILIHLNPVTNEVVYYKETWSDCDSTIISKTNLNSNPIEGFYKQKVMFIDKQDCLSFYTIDDSISFPFICWEVRNYDGTTTLIDNQNAIVGWGVPAPSKGFSLSGFNENSWPDPWIEYRENADDWFSNWCDDSVSLSLPTPSSISSYVSDPETMFFYELAHGDQYSFQADSVGSSYYANGQAAYSVEKDLQNRDPFTFAFIGSCHGLTTVVDGTFSYEFRKGETEDTVTVGYDHMESCPGWEHGYYWQDLMFNYMDQGYTIKEAFDQATAYYPTIAPAVVFVGDESLTVYDAFGDLSSQGTFEWTSVNPSTEITGTIQIENTGNAGSNLDWEIASYPIWGDWTFSPDHGVDITPEDGIQTIQVTLVTPSMSNSEFSGEIKVVNTNNQNDFDILPIQLSTPKQKIMSSNIVQFLQQYFPWFRFLVLFEYV